MHEQGDDSFSLKNVFVPLTTLKAISIIVIVGFVVFGNVLFNGFAMDDLPYIIFNPGIHSIDIPLLFSRNLFNTPAYYRPIPAVYFSILYNIFGDQAFFYHFIQVSLHIFNACLLFGLLKRFIGKPVSFFIVMLFLIHPIQVESVAYIAATQSELFFLFGMSALLISSRQNIQGKQLLLIAGFSLLSLFTKETGFLFVLMILFFQAIFKKKRFFKFLGLEFVTVAIYFFIRLYIGGSFLSKIEFAPITRLTLAERLINIPEIVFYYIKTTLFPMRLAVEQHWTVTKLTVQDFYLPLLLVTLFFLALGAYGVYIYKYNKDYGKSYLYFSLWFILGIFMIIQIFPLDMTVADRWFYFPLVGLLGTFGVGIKQHLLQKKLYQSMGILFASVIIIVLSLRTITRNTNWYTGTTLYAHDIQMAEADNFVNHSNYAMVLSNAGKNELALDHAKKSIALYPFEKNLVNTGWLYFRLGQREEGMKYLYQGLRAKSFPFQSDPHLHDEETYILIARLQLLYGDVKEALSIAQQGVQDYPKSPNLWLLLALSEYKIQNQREANVAIEKAYALSPDEQTGNVRTRILNKLPIEVSSVE